MLFLPTNLRLNNLAAAIKDQSKTRPLSLAQLPLMAQMICFYIAIGAQNWCVIYAASAPTSTPHPRNVLIRMICLTISYFCIDIRGFCLAELRLPIQVLPLGIFTHLYASCDITANSYSILGQLHGQLS